VSDRPSSRTGPDDQVVCPHCNKPFTADLVVGGEHARYRGFKCPHCRLFVPAERVAES
jgi:DNA-directed RNA polymerase subunit RPC12/RpoP